MKKSAGILPYRLKDGRVEVFLGHLGGIFWKNKNRSWGIIKGEVKRGESDEEAAKREFFEETGKRVEKQLIDLGEIKTSNKILHIFGVKQNFDTDIRSNMVTVTYKGKQYSFPEIDKAQWFDIEEAKKIIIPSQKPFLDKILKICF